MSIRKTYEAPGMREWVALIPTRNNIVRVHFSGGSETGMGTAPATFTTDNPAVCALIEASSYFKRGRILLGEESKENEGNDENAGCRDSEVSTDSRRLTLAAEAVAAMKRDENGNQYFGKPK